jgi:hypothetical protein
MTLLWPPLARIHLTFLSNSALIHGFRIAVAHCIATETTF